MVEMMLIDWALANGYTAGVEDELGKGCGGREGKCYKFDQDLGRAPWLGGMPKADEKGKSARDRGHEHHGDLSRFVQNGMERMAKKRLQKNWETEWRKEQAKPAQNRRSHRALRSELEKRVRDEVKREVEQKLPKVLKVMHQYSQMGDGISLLSP